MTRRRRAMTKPHAPGRVVFCAAPFRQDTQRAIRIAFFSSAYPQRLPRSVHRAGSGGEVLKNKSMVKRRGFCYNTSDPAATRETPGIFSEREAFILDRNRPQGREKYVTNNSTGIHKRGSGLNTGPVGSGTGPNGGNQTSQKRDYGTSYSSSSSSGRRKSPLIAIIAAVIALAGGGGLFGSGILGGGDADVASTPSAYTQEYTQTTPSVTPQASPSPVQSAAPSASSGSGSGSLNGAIGNILGGSSSTGWSDSSNSAQVNNTVASGIRDRYTEMLGGGRDEITIMVYMCGADLESKSAMATKDIMEMTKATLSDNIHLIVYTGGAKKWNNQVISSQTNQIYEVKSGGLRCLVQDAGSSAMTKPETLASFIKWCSQNYPANRNALIFWDHGGGSVSGYGYDEKYASSGSMSLEGISSALKSAGTTFDFIGFDTCLMATVENALMLDNYADYMIASEETEPGIGWYYTDWLTKLSRNTSMGTVEVGKNIVDDFVATCESQCRGQAATLSVVDLAELAHTVPAPLKSFSQSLSSLITNKEYKQISDARNGTREFARSSAIDQIDLVHFAKNIGNTESSALAKAILAAVKYNRTSSNMSNAYGLSIYFPYRKVSSVDKAVKTYNAIGMDESYSQCIREFASLEVSGQVSTGGTTSALPSLLGSFGGSSASGSTDMISSLLGSFLGGDFGSMSGFSSGNTGFFSGRSLSTEDTVSYIADNFFDGSALTWTQNADGDTVISLPEEQWSLVEGLDLNAFYDDGEGFIDLGLDNVFDFDDEGNLLASTDRTWLAVNGQPVAYYHEFTQGEGDDLVIFGRIPALLNGERVDLLVTFDSANPHGAITGARAVYADGETETVAKSETELNVGDTLDFICDYYTYDGEYENSYFLGEQMTVSENMEISNVDVGDGTLRITYRFTDLYQQHYWTEPFES